MLAYCLLSDLYSFFISAFCLAYDNFLIPSRNLLWPGFYLSFNRCSFFFAMKYLRLVNIVSAAFFVIPTYLMAIFWLSSRLKILETVTTNKARSRAPQRANTIVMDLPITVHGDMSPYPIVVIVMTVNQIELKKLSNTGSPSAVSARSTRIETGRWRSRPLWNACVQQGRGRL